MARIVAMTSGSHPEQNRADLFASLRRREEFLSTCSRILAESLDYQRTLDAVARLAVPDIADSCRIDLLDEAGTLVPAAAEHRDPRVAQLEVRSTIRTPLSAHGRILGTLTLSTAGERQLTPDHRAQVEKV